MKQKEFGKMIIKANSVGVEMRSSVREKKIT